MLNGPSPLLLHTSWKLRNFISIVHTHRLIVSLAWNFCCRKASTIFGKVSIHMDETIIFYVLSDFRRTAPCALARVYICYVSYISSYCSVAIFLFWEILARSRAALPIQPCKEGFALFAPKHCSNTHGSNLYRRFGSARFLLYLCWTSFSKLWVIWNARFGGFNVLEAQVGNTWDYIDLGDAFFE